MTAERFAQLLDKWIPVFLFFAGTYPAPDRYAPQWHAAAVENSVAAAGPGSHFAAESGPCA